MWKVYISIEYIYTRKTYYILYINIIYFTIVIIHNFTIYNIYIRGREKYNNNNNNNNN